MANAIRRGPNGTGGRLARGLALGSALLASALIFSAGPALAVVAPVYDNIPTTLPGNVPSMAFEATGTSEFGDLVTFDPGSRASESLPVTVVMSSWGCQTGGGATCHTTPGATWPQPLTLTLYQVVGGTPPKVGDKITSVTNTFNLLYRPSYDSRCPAKDFYAWFSDVAGRCFNGLAQAITFDLPQGITLPDTLIWGVSFDTTHYGYHPLGGDGGAWDSLNVGVQPAAGKPANGTDVEPDSAFLNSSSGGSYADGGEAGLGTFRDDVGGWTNQAPLACFGIACSVNAPPPTPTPTPTPTPSPTPVASVTGEPSQQVAGATGTPRAPTPPPTSTGGSSGGSSSQELAVFLCFALGAIGLTAVYAQRRSLRNSLASARIHRS